MGISNVACPVEAGKVGNLAISIEVPPAPTCTTLVGPLLCAEMWSLKGEPNARQGVCACVFVNKFKGDMFIEGLGGRGCDRGRGRTRWRWRLGGMNTRHVRGSSTRSLIGRVVCDARTGRGSSMAHRSRRRRALLLIGHRNRNRGRRWQRRW
jgi:hypothetical protein